MTWWVGLIDFSADANVESDGRCTRSYMLKYLVRTDSPTFPSYGDVATAVGINRGAPFAQDTNAICRKLSIGPGPTMTRVPFLAFTATYEFATNAPAPDSDDDDPTSRRELWSIGPQIQSRYVIRDRLDKLIVNTAGSPFDGGIPVDVRLGSATVTRNKLAAGYDVDSVLANSGKLNSQPFLGGPPGTVQVDISAVEKFEGGYHFWAETFTFSYDPLGWQPKPVNAGFFLLSGAGVPRRITNGDVGDTVDPDSKTQEPEPLDAAGAIVPPASRPASCIFIDVDYFDTMDFAAFGLTPP